MLKIILNFAAFSVLALANPLLAADTKVTGNTIEKVSLKVEGKTGEPSPQYFSKKVKAKIVKIFDQKQDPAIWGTVSITGVGTDIVLVEIRASGYPGGRFSSTLTFQVMY